ncbi:MAG: PHP domain-containing protein [Actinomycetia bacterium]|nr:PHP domain-containing protein [Actinomycetes bacterium]
MIDFHLHLWPHDLGTPQPTFELLERYCERAAEAGIDQIAVTEHSYRFTRVAAEVIPHWERPLHGEVAEASAHVLELEGGADLDGYVRALDEAKRQGLPLLVGLEVDYWPGAIAAMAEVVADYPFDVLLGSVHWLDDWLFDAYEIPAFARRWTERDTDEVYDQYVDSVIDLAQSGLVDVLAHVDVIKVAGHIPSNIEEHYNRLISAVVAADVAVEFSSGGLRKPTAATYPTIDMMKRLVEVDVPLTTASDAHTVDQVGHRFDVLDAALDAAGAISLASFAKRQRHLIERQ